MRHEAFALALLISCSLPEHGMAAPNQQWYRGNTHCHTNLSDGDAPLGVVARWYRDHGYDFVCITDHDKVTSVTDVQTELDREVESSNTRRLLLVPGQEITDGLQDNGRDICVHVNALGATDTLPKKGGKNVADMLQGDLDIARRGSTVAQLNHPNYKWSITASHILALSNVTHVEFFNGCGENNWGGGDMPSSEQMWDTVLSRGKRVFIVASDDAHNYSSLTECNPGTGYIMVRAEGPGRQQVLEAMRRGDFYASTGVELKDVETTGGTLRLAINRQGDRVYTTVFTGKDGVVLKVDRSMEPRYDLQPGDMYVRARVMSSNGRYA